MIRGRYIVFALFCLFFFPIVTRAECSYERMAELNKIAGNVQVSYSYDPIKDANGNVVDVTSNLLFSNVSPDIYLVDDLDNVIDKDSVISYEFSDDVEVSIYSKDPNCYGIQIVKNYISIPHINSLYYSDDCVQNPGFKFCQLWLDSNSIDYDVFKSELAKYKKQLEGDYNQSDNSSFNFDYKLIIIPVIIVTLVIIFLFFLKRRRKL